jgi:hypothetical protein
MVKNDVVPAPPVLRKRPRTVITFGVALFVGMLGLAGCGRTHPPAFSSGGTASAAATPTDPADQLAGLAATARDRKYVAAYTYRAGGGPNRTVVASIATDGTWSVNVPGGALGGGGDVSIVSDDAGVFQCLLGGRATTLAPVIASPQPSGSPTPGASPSPSTFAFAAPVCVRVASAGKTVPRRYDPIMEHVFTDWLTALSSRNTPISVFAARALPNSSGTCFSVEPSAASLAPVVDAGIFCFRNDGTLTAVKLAEGSLTLRGAVAPAAPTNALPAPVSTGPAAPTDAQP